LLNVIDNVKYCHKNIGKGNSFQQQYHGIGIIGISTVVGIDNSFHEYC